MPQRVVGCRPAAQGGLDFFWRHIGSALAGPGDLEGLALVTDEGGGDIVRFRFAGAAPPQIVRNAFLGRLVDGVLFDQPGDGELDGVAQGALTDAIAAGDDGEAAAEIDPCLGNHGSRRPLHNRAS